MTEKAACSFGGFFFLVWFEFFIPSKGRNLCQTVWQKLGEIILNTFIARWRFQHS